MGTRGVINGWVDRVCGCLLLCEKKKVQARR